MTMSNSMLSASPILVTIAILSFHCVRGEVPLSHTKCASSFVKYTPSAFEKKWADNVAAWENTVCEHMSKDEANWWLGNVSVLVKDNIGSAITSDSDIPPHRPWSEMLPTFTYSRKCYHKTDGSALMDYVHIPIEPTAGLCRDPRKCWDPASDEFTQSKAYLIPLSYKGATTSAMHTYHPHESLQQQGAMAYLFDAGATVAGSTGRDGTTGWSGTEWIFDWYEQRGIVFDQVFAWEPTEQVVNAQHLKPELVKALHFYNVGITAGRDDEHNPLARIRAMCKPNDIVVFKLDIDSAIELEIVKQLLGDDQLMGLVDEFYFEHHVRNKAMAAHGLDGPGNPGRDTLQSWYDMVLPARAKGLHMHFWP